MSDIALKTLLFVAWPFIAAGLLLITAICFAIAWPLIPFGVVRREGGKFKVQFRREQ